MPNILIRRLIVLGGLSIIGILFIQSYWLVKTWDIKDKEFDQTVNIVLRNVAQRMSKFSNTVLPKSGLIQRKSSNYYAVNINSTIDAGYKTGGIDSASCMYGRNGVICKIEASGGIEFDVC